jgi:2-polyprenyl-3-methyl-5-hydroxy-6-metoxy-1,4-benzoquinol methylase
MRSYEEDGQAVFAKEKFKLYNECPICGFAMLKDKFTVKGFSLARCRQCSVVFVKEIVSVEHLKAFYQDQEGYCLYDDENKDCINYYNKKIKGEIESLVPGKGKILDLGCSSGMFLELMDGWERHGVEISEKYGSIARKKIGSGIFVGPFESYPAQNGYFDVITMFDMFDHLIDPLQSLAKCYAMLKPGGLIVIKVHNMSCLYAKVTGPAFYAIQPPAHLFYYNKHSLKFILGKTGFDFIGSKFIGHLLKLQTVFYRLSRNNRYSLAYKIYLRIAGSFLGEIKIYKNLRDIITVFAVKK